MRHVYWTRLRHKQMNDPGVQRRKSYTSRYLDKSLKLTSVKVNLTTAILTTSTSSNANTLVRQRCSHRQRIKWKHLMTTWSLTQIANQSKWRRTSCSIAKQGIESPLTISSLTSLIGMMETKRRMSDFSKECSHSSPIDRVGITCRISPMMLLMTILLRTLCRCLSGMESTE